MQDLLLYILTEQAKPREIYHGLGRLEQVEDLSPLISEDRVPNRSRLNLSVVLTY